MYNKKWTEQQKQRTTGKFIIIMAIIVQIQSVQ